MAPSHIQQRLYGYKNVPNLITEILPEIDLDICSQEIKHIRLISRKGRRRVLNEEALLKAAADSIPNIDIRLVHFGNDYSYGENELANRNISVRVTSDGAPEVLRREKHMIDDLLSIQNCAVLIGVQVDLLINLYVC